MPNLDAIAMLDKYLSKNFREREFRCKCRKAVCDAAPMQPEFIEILQKIRDRYGKPMPILSGARCHDWNAIVGGKPHSQHLLGKAVDVGFSSPQDLGELLAVATDMDVGGIGIATSFLHLDNGPKGRRWSY